MAQFVLIRPVHFIPGKRDEALAWAKETEVVRRNWGLIEQLVVRSIVDPSENLFIQIWRDRESYEKWRESDDWRRITAERARYIANDPTRLYEEIGD